jgi:gamma-glutamyltranspeptidase
MSRFTKWLGGGLAAVVVVTAIGVVTLHHTSSSSPSSSGKVTLCQALTEISTFNSSSAMTKERMTIAGVADSLNFAHRTFTKVSPVPSTVAVSLDHALTSSAVLEAIAKVLEKHPTMTAAQNALSKTNFPAWHTSTAALAKWQSKQCPATK